MLNIDSMVSLSSRVSELTFMVVNGDEVKVMQRSNYVTPRGKSKQFVQ